MGRAGRVCAQPAADRETDRIGRFRHPVGFGRVGRSQDLRFARKRRKVSEISPDLEEISPDSMRFH